METTTGPGLIREAEFNADPHGTLRKHRHEHWYAHLEQGIPQVLAYDSVRDLMGRDEELRGFLGPFFASIMAQNPALPPELVERQLEQGRHSMINLDGEPHHALRARVARAFTPRTVASLRPYLEEKASELAGRLQPGDDFMQSFARDLPSLALCALTGIPEEDHERFVGWIDVLEVMLSAADLSRLDAEGGRALLAANDELTEYALALVARRRESPRDDLISRLAADPDDPLSDDALVALIGDLIFAGNDTTRNAIGSMVLLLASHGDAWERVAAEPAFAEAVVEEVLRLESPAPGPVRVAACPVDHRDASFAAGEVVLLSTWSANRDEDFWGPGSDDFCPGRPDGSQHLAFGYGPHFCLGASLAREEMRAALVALTARLTGLRVTERPEMRPPGSIYGPVSLKLDFTRR